MIRRSNYVLLGLTGVLTTTLTVGCGLIPKAAKTEPSNSTAQGQQQGQGLPLETSLLVADDLKLSAGYTLSDISQSQIIDNLNKEPVLYNHQPKSKTPSSEPSTGTVCSPTTTGTVVANKVSVKVLSTTDNTDCLRKELSKFSGTIVSVKNTTKSNFYLSCSSKDLSYLNGKKISELEAEGENFGCTNGTLLGQSIEDTESTTITDGVTYVTKIRNLNHTGTKIFAPCKFSTAGTTETIGDDCISFNKIENLQKNGTDAEEAKTSAITQYSFTGVTDDISASTNVWHNTGKIDVIYNDWTGTVTYKGSNTAPTYTLKETPTTSPTTGSLTATEVQ
jgi:hypothetical protein